MANGQCFLARRDLLLRGGGYTPARRSWSDDVTLARHYARSARVGFADGSRLFTAQPYRSLYALWGEWGRSIDLSDSTNRRQQALDVATLVLVQGLPVIAVAGVVNVGTGGIWLNVALLAMSILMRFAVAPSYHDRGLLYWLSPLSDPLAVARVVISTLRRPRRWRGRTYRPVR
jgi:dolichol-phosphate mannosyltransferase